MFKKKYNGVSRNLEDGFFVTTFKVCLLMLWAVFIFVFAIFFGVMFRDMLTMLLGV